jgi:N-acyl-D-aspartate/D-glutamate deacylase
VPGLSDGGAHCGIICDASFPTYLLTHWRRDRKRGEKLSIPFVIAAQSRKTARSVGLSDRGVILAGYKADINVIDYNRLHLHPPGCITTCRSAVAACCSRSMATTPPSFPVW